MRHHWQKAPEWRTAGGRHDGGRDDEASTCQTENDDQGRCGRERAAVDEWNQQGENGNAVAVRPATIVDPARRVRRNAGPTAPASISCSPDTRRNKGTDDGLGRGEEVASEAEGQGEGTAAAGIENQVRIKISLLDRTSVEMMEASPVGIANRQKPEGMPRGRRGLKMARR